VIFTLSMIGLGSSLGYETHDYIGWRGSVKWSPGHIRWVPALPADEGVRRSTSVSPKPTAWINTAIRPVRLPLIAAGSLDRQSIVEASAVI